MRVLPILWEKEPTPEDWRNLSAAREATGRTEKVMPAAALPGSPAPILAIGTRPTWLTDYAYAEGSESVQEALEYCLDGETREEVGELYADLLGGWLGVEVKYVVEERMESSVKFT